MLTIDIKKYIHHAILYISHVLENIMTLNKTFIPKVKNLKRDWFIVDAEGLILGRMASIIANRLRGKHKTFFTPNMQCGDNIIVVNCEKVILKGQKLQNKRHYWHTGYPGGIKSKSPKNILEGKIPSELIKLAVKRMVPKGPLGRKILKQLFIFKGTEHPYEAQKPVSLDIKSMNRKNS